MMACPTTRPSVSCSSIGRDRRPSKPEMPRSRRKAKRKRRDSTACEKVWRSITDNNGHAHCGPAASDSPFTAWQQGGIQVHSMLNGAQEDSMRSEYA